MTAPLSRVSTMRRTPALSPAMRRLWAPNHGQGQRLTCAASSAFGWGCCVFPALPMMPWSLVPSHGSQMRGMPVGIPEGRPEDCPPALLRIPLHKPWGDPSGQQLLAVTVLTNTPNLHCLTPLVSQFSALHPRQSNPSPVDATPDETSERRSPYLLSSASVAAACTRWRAKAKGLVTSFMDVRPTMSRHHVVRALEPGIERKRSGDVATLSLRSLSRLGDRWTMECTSGERQAIRAMFWQHRVWPGRHGCGLLPEMPPVWELED